jgi:hypothetical protein
MSTERETVYIGRANVIRRVLQANDADLTEVQQSAVTRVQFAFGTHCLDTANVSDPISYADGVVEMQLGLVAGLEAAKNVVGRLIVYDAVTPEGKAWGSVTLQIVEWEACSV